MYELIQVTEHTYYIECPARIGLYVEPDGGAWIIDTGNDKDAGKKVLKQLAAQGWTARAILNTHSNADHIGGNRLITERTQAPAFAPGAEAAFSCRPELEAAFLYGGYPAKPLQNKFLRAEPSLVRDLREAELPAGMEILPLPGHFFDMVGFRTPDGVCFLADCLSGENILAKYPVAFLYDVRAYLDTLSYVCTLSAPFFVPAHAPVQTDIRPLAERNRAQVLENAELIAGLCAAPAGFAEILKGVFDHFSLTMDFNQYVLVGSTVRSYLAWLLDEGRLRADFVENRLLWQRID